MLKSGSDQASVAIVVPVYNEAEVLPEFWRRLEAVMQASTGFRFHAIFVDDGSRDRSFAILQEIAARDARVSAIRFSRNFGKEAAMTAGIDYADADWTVIIDADLQDPPELIPEMLRRAGDGYDVVLAHRTSRHGESWHKQFFSHLFYRLMGILNPGFDLPTDTGDYRLMSRRAIAALARLRESNRFMKGIFAWIGFPTSKVSYERDPRYSGTSKFDFLKLLNHAIDGITSFSTMPLRIATYLGLLVSLLAFAYGIAVVIRTALYGDPVAGFPTLIASILFLGGVQLLCIGIIGEYVGRIYGEAKQRPLYLIEGIAGTHAQIKNDPPQRSREAQAPVDTK
ncbi:glycosyltransferase family 2 protein [Sinimarinibacterium sp. CAU 1509]|uniref:glycosyltransferase family 2 protein n=1 Tax=Sinimarinibacterium sp. CAU 1509 TaxID=2562283 RepID=UPI0010AC2824|nr:glycosyltransferase family 2 protein [Sinimarinibacterium sp. CAU 1509]TJY61965.1 glycosyltransferase family 2 protein [Sinimarinibacterium sp. CAU 1509]